MPPITTNPSPRPLPPAAAPRDVDELKTLLARHSSLSPAEERLLVDAFERARSRPSSNYDVIVSPDTRLDNTLVVAKFEAFKGLPAPVQERLGALVDDLKGRFMVSVQEKKPWKLTLGMRRPLIQHAYKTVGEWNKLIGELSKTKPELAELKLKFGKGTDGLMRDELMAKLGAN